MRPVFLHIAMLAFAPTVHTEPQLTRVLLNDTEISGAVCLDGTPAGWFVVTTTTYCLWRGNAVTFACASVLFMLILDDVINHCYGVLAPSFSLFLFLSRSFSLSLSLSLSLW